MKLLKNYITEAFKINKNTKLESRYKYFPKTKDELKDIINQLIEAEGSKCDLNDIDVSEIKDMSWLFCNSVFNGDISRWDVSNVTNMPGMFKNSNFNGDISNWNISNVKNMSYMFTGSKFNRDISNWEITYDTKREFIFSNTPIQKNFKPNFNLT